MAEQWLQDPGVDLAELLGRVEGDRELLRDIFEIFKEEFPKSYQVLTEAVATRDLKQVQVSAHTLKGMFSSLSFVRASGCARRIEQMARGLQPEGIAAEVACLERTVRAAQACLQQACIETRP